jgi:sialidase-1
MLVSLLLVLITLGGVPPAKAMDPATEAVLFASLSDPGRRYFFRIPALVALNDAQVLVAFAEQRVGNNDDWGDINVVYRVSTDDGATWTPIRRVCELGRDTCGNPTAVVDQVTGVLHLFMMSGPRGVCQLERQVGVNGCTRVYGVGERRVLYTSARFDAGHLVFDPELRDMTETLQEPWRRFDLIGPGAGIQLTHPEAGYAGRLLVPALGRTFLSDDHGETWRLSRGRLSPVSSEPTLAELDDGRVLRNDRVRRSMRERFPSRLLSVSATGGEHFPAFTYTSLPVPDPAVQASMLRFGQGQIFFANCASSTHRRDLTIRQTADGQDWSDGRRIDAGCGYSSLAKSADDHVAILYERPGPEHSTHREKPLELVFRKFEPGYLLGP